MSFLESSECRSLQFKGGGGTKREMGISIIITSGAEDCGRESFGSESLFVSSM